MSNVTRSIECEAQPSQATGPKLNPDLDIVSLLSAPPQREVRSKEHIVMAVPPVLNGQGGLWWA